MVGLKIITLSYVGKSSHRLPSGHCKRARINEHARGVDHYRAVGGSIDPNKSRIRSLKSRDALRLMRAEGITIIDQTLVPSGVDVGNGLGFDL